MHTQLIKETILSLEYNKQSIKDSIIDSIEHYIDYPTVLKSVIAFTHNFYFHFFIWWYSSPSFVYLIFNRALRNLDTSTITKMTLFICDLHRQFEQLPMQQSNSDSISQIFTVHRDQDLLSEDFEKLRKTKGSLLSFDNFLSTSLDRDISSAFALSASDATEFIPVLFHITAGPSKSTTLFARIGRFSYYSDEKEILFSMRADFWIGEIKHNAEHRKLYETQLMLTDDNDPQLNELI